MAHKHKGNHVTKRPKLSEKTREKLTEHFIGGTTARSADELIGINGGVAAKWFHWFSKNHRISIRREPSF